VPVVVLFAAITMSMAGEVVFKGLEVGISKGFVCNGKRPGGHYTIEVVHDTTPEDRTVLRVIKGEEVLCETKGAPTSAYESMKPSKPRIFTKVDGGKKVVQFDLVIPVGFRGSVPNQSFILPLSAGN
jgi:hypothetical protein